MSNKEQMELYVEQLQADLRFLRSTNADRSEILNKFKELTNAYETMNLVKKKKAA